MKELSFLLGEDVIVPITHYSNFSFLDVCVMIFLLNRTLFTAWLL